MSMLAKNLYKKKPNDKIFLSQKKKGKENVTIVKIIKS